MRKWTAASRINFYFHWQMKHLPVLLPFINFSDGKIYLSCRLMIWQQLRPALKTDNGGICNCTIHPVTHIEFFSRRRALSTAAEKGFIWVLRLYCARTKLHQAQVVHWSGNRSLKFPLAKACKTNTARKRIPTSQPKSITIFLSADRTVFQGDRRSRCRTMRHYSISFLFVVGQLAVSEGEGQRRGVPARRPDGYQPRNQTTPRQTLSHLRPSARPAAGAATRPGPPVRLPAWTFPDPQVQPGTIPACSY